MPIRGKDNEEGQEMEGHGLGEGATDVFSRRLTIHSFSTGESSSGNSMFLTDSRRYRHVWGLDTKVARRFAYFRSDSDVRQVMWCAGGSVSLRRGLESSKFQSSKVGSKAEIAA